MTVDESRRVLGLDTDADEKTVRRAYAKLAKVHRPDTHPKEFLNIRTAYDVLLASIKEDTYQDPSLPVTPNDISAAATNVNVEVANVDGQVLSYVIGADELGRADLDDAIPESSFLEPSDNNPLQPLEDELVEAIKATQPGVRKTEDKVVALSEQYLAAAGATSRQLRDYVERFLIGACLGDYYVPHPVRIRVAELCGLHNTVVAEDKLKPWEKELIVRFDESEWLDGLLEKATSTRHRAEHALVHGSGWSQVLTLRLGQDESKTVNRWMHWLDNTYGSDFGVVNERFRSQWHRLRQVGAVNGPVVLAFTALMLVSGWVLDTLGVPLQHFFQLPTLFMLQLLASLAVLSWINFALVQLARPVIDRFIAIVRDGLFEHLPIPILVLELVATAVLIWAWSFQPMLTEAMSLKLMTVAGLVMLLVGVFTRVWDGLTELSFSAFGMRVVWHSALFIFLVFYQGSQAEADRLGDVGRWTHVDLVGAAWLLLGFTVVAVPPRVLHRWHEMEPGNKKLSLTHIRHTNLTFTTHWVRLVIGCVAGLCLLGVGAEFLLQGSGWVSPLITATLLTLLATEVALAGGVHDESNDRKRILAYSVGFIIYWLMTRILSDGLYVAMLAHTTIAVLLLWLVVRCHSAKSPT